MKTLLQKHQKAARAMILGYVAFAGCFAFPFRNELFQFNLFKAYLVLLSYGIIGLGFAMVYGAGKIKSVYGYTLVLTGVGMLLRYILEYGEVSNTLNFTTFNIWSYLILVPIYCVLMYKAAGRWLVKET